MLARFKRWFSIHTVRWISKRFSHGCPWRFDIQQHFAKGEYELAGKKLLYYYGPCHLDNLPDVNQYLSEYYHVKGDREKHRFHLDRALSLYNFANDPRGIGRACSYSLLARDNWEEKDYQRVIEYGAQALEIAEYGPVNIVVHYLLSCAYREMGNMEKAEEHRAKYDELCNANEPYLYQPEGQDFKTISVHARNSRIPYEQWKEMTDKEKTKALLKAKHYPW